MHLLCIRLFALLNNSFLIFSSLSFFMRLPPPLWITMGCAISRLNLPEEGMACGLKQRMVESSPSKKDLLDTRTTSSTKLLLKDVPPPGDHHHAREASSDSVVMKEPPLPPQISEMERLKGECGPRGTEKEESDGTEDDDKDFGRRISDFDGNWIGSPSFREYCVDSESDQDFVNHGRGNREDMEKKVQVTDNLASSKEVCVVPGPKILEKKGSRGRKFIRVFPIMHKPKNLWHVTTCYSRNNHHVPTERLPEKEIKNGSTITDLP